MTSSRPTPRTSGRGARRAKVVLAADIGGTKTNVGLYRSVAGRLRRTELRRFDSHAFASVEEILDLFLGQYRVRIDAAAFGIAGPVIGGRSVATNLPWIIDERKVSRRLRAPVRLLNDLEAMAHSIPHLRPAQMHSLNRGRAVPNGNLALIAAGTGLGEAFVVRTSGQFEVGASEGGHSSFAPRDDREIALLRVLAKRFGHVSWERLLSGPGLVNIFRALGTDDVTSRITRGVTSRITRGTTSRSARGTTSREARRLPGRAPELSPIDPAEISRAAFSGRSARAAEAVAMFATLYGSEAGNLALKYLATGGVYLGGGIAPKLLPALRKKAFLRAFQEKGRFRPLLRAIPVRVILDEHAALLGAASVAVRCVTLRASFPRA